MATYEAEIMDIELDGREYTVEFDREALDYAYKLNPTEKANPLESTAIVMCAGMRKHHPSMTPTKARRLIDWALDNGYGLDDFSEIMEEYVNCLSATFSASDEKRKKLISRRSE